MLLKKKFLKPSVEARRLQTSVSNLSHLMSGKHRPGKRLARALLREYGIPLDAWNEEVREA